jgi:uncharacterized coiled-coil protein SlyX
MKEKEVEEALKTAGCSSSERKDIIGSLESRSSQQAETELQKLRCKTIGRKRICEKQIDCLDYLIFRLKEEKADE